MNQATADGLADGFFGTPKPHQPLLPGSIIHITEQPSLFRSEGDFFEVCASRFDLLNIHSEMLMAIAPTGDGDGESTAMGR